MNLFIKENFEKYSMFSSIKETKCYFIIKTKIDMSNDEYKFSIKIKKKNYKITVSSFQYHLFEKFKNKRHVIFTEKWYLFNVKRNEQDAFIIINRFFQSKENQLEDFI